MEVGCGQLHVCAPTTYSLPFSLPLIHSPLTQGKEIKAQCMPEAQYHGIFPMAMSAMIPLRPSS